MTYLIIALCVVVYILQWVLPGDLVFQDFAYANIFAGSEPWRMLTSAFLHSQGFLLHIVLNMYSLWIFGQVLEPLLGRLRFLAVYLLAAVGGSVGFLLLTPTVPPVGLVGASGAIFGLFGALLVVQRQRGGQTRQLWVLIVLNGVIGFLVPGIAWQAHLGGLITGAIAAAAITYAPRGKSQALIQAASLVLVLGVLAAITWFHVSAS